MKLAQSVANAMFSKNVNDLEKEEPEKSGTNYGKYFKQLVVLVVFIYLFISIAYQ